MYTENQRQRQVKSRNIRTLYRKERRGPYGAEGSDLHRSRNKMTETVQWFLLPHEKEFKFTSSLASFIVVVNYYGWESLHTLP